MLSLRSWRARLAVWYFATVAAIVVLAGVAYWFTIRDQLDRALDQGLRYQLIGLIQYLEHANAQDSAAISARLDAVSRIGDLHVVFDQHGVLLAQSHGLTRHGVFPVPPRDLGYNIRYESGGSREFPVRLAWQRVWLHRTRPLVLGVADPQRKFDGVLRAFTALLLGSIPLILILATVCGLWLGRLALAPVARIMDDARAITEGNLSARLAVPASGDELQQLSETLNDMLARIEYSFVRMRQFTADASHELRAPMTLISTAAQWALRRDRGHDELLDSLRKIERESRRTTVLIDDLLRLARGDAGLEPALLEQTDPTPILLVAVQQATDMASQKNIDVVTAVDPGLPAIKASAPHLERLLLILIDNAVKYTPAGGVVTITGSADPTALVIVVGDTGVGIAPTDTPHVFERFWRADTVRSRQAGGSGLGLAMAKQIADRHGATLTVSSTVDQGSTFTLTVPRSSA